MEISEMSPYWEAICYRHALTHTEYHGMYSVMNVAN